MAAPFKNGGKDKKDTIAWKDSKVYVRDLILNIELILNL